MREDVPILGEDRGDFRPLLVVRQQPAVNQRWAVCLICQHFGRETRFQIPEESAAYERHFAACSDRHMDELKATETLAGKAPGLFGPAVGDVELEQWFDRDGGRNRRAVLEGRKRV